MAGKTLCINKPAATSIPLPIIESLKITSSVILYV